MEDQPEAAQPPMLHDDDRDPLPRGLAAGEASGMIERSEGEAFRKMEGERAVRETHWANPRHGCVPRSARFRFAPARSL